MVELENCSSTISMILLKELLQEAYDDSADRITPATIYNFHFLATIYARNPEMLKKPYAEEIFSYYMGRYKKLYINMFKKLISDQLKKYVSRGRVDSDFDKNKVESNLDGKTLWHQMEKTFRSDMKRRNNVWNDAAKYLYELENAKSYENIIKAINGLNSQVHNTQTLMLGKLDNGHDLMRAYDATRYQNSELGWIKNVAKDIRAIEDNQYQ